MNKLLLTLGLAACVIHDAPAQGTINPLNGALTKVRFDSNLNGTYDSDDRLIVPADGVRFGVFWGEAGGPANTFAGEMTIGDTPGVMTGLPAIFSVQGWGDEGTIISLQICVFAGGGGSTGTKQVTLGRAGGPGTVIWGSTATATRFTPLLINAGGFPPCPPVPEPSTLALGALGGLGLLLVRRARRTTAPRR